MFLNNHYKVTTTTDLHTLSEIANNSGIDLIIIDSPPTTKIYDICKNYKRSSVNSPLVLTYVYDKKLDESERIIRSAVDEIFYKPFDLNEISQKIPQLVSA